MAYLLYSVSFLLFATAVALILTRARWLPYLEDHTSFLPFSLPGRDYLYSQLPTGGGGFAGDMEAGLSSATFDLAGNVEGDDARAGLNDASKAEILRIMKTKRVKFDEARRIYIQNRFKASGIAPDGRPRDPKFVSFS